MMRINKVVGINIGNYRISVSYVIKGQLKSYFCENIPDNAVKDGMIQYWDAMAEFLRDTLKQHGIKCKNVIFSAPLNGVYIRNIELPLMNLQQLELNLPFEFHDYISESSDKYFYDYAVIEKTEKSIKLQAVACSKDLIDRYRKLAKNAKLIPVGLVPEVIGIQRILNTYMQLFSIDKEKDFAILDMGDRSFKIHFYKDGIYSATRTFEPGGHALAEKVSEINRTDVHISHLAIEENLNNIQSHPELVQMYENRAVEIMRALNFYSYSNTNNSIDALYYCGGTSNIRKYIKILSETVNLPVRPLSDLVGVMDDEIRESFISCPQSHGITIDPEHELKPLSKEEAEKILDHIEQCDKQRLELYKDEEFETTEMISTGSQAEPNVDAINAMASQVGKEVEKAAMAASISEASDRPMSETVSEAEPTGKPVVEAMQESGIEGIVPKIIPSSEYETSESVPVMDQTDDHVAADESISRISMEQGLKPVGGSELRTSGFEAKHPGMESTVNAAEGSLPVIGSTDEPASEPLPVIGSTEAPSGDEHPGMEATADELADRLIKLNDYMDESEEQHWEKHLDEDEYESETDKAIDELTERFLKGQSS